MFTILDLFLTMGFSWIILGIALLIINKKSILISPIYGISLLFVFGLTLLDNFIKPGMLNPSFSRIIFSVLRNSYFLIGPGLWFYCKILFNEKQKKRKLELIHLIPFVIAVILWLIFDRSSLLPPGRPIHPPKYPQNIKLLNIANIRDLSSKISRVIYSIVIILKISKRSRGIKDFYSNLSNKNTLNWLFYITLFYLILFLSDTVFLIKPLKSFIVKFDLSIYVRIVPSLIFIFFYTIYSQNQPIPEDNKNKKYKKSGLNINDSITIFESSNIVLKDKKLFINPDFNLDLLADEINETRHRVSEAINKHAKENFYSYINRYRLNEFLLSIKENRFPNYTILAIAYECGFKSTSAFYTFFKRQMNMTPKEYMQMEKVV